MEGDGSRSERAAPRVEVIVTASDSQQRSAIASLADELARTLARFEELQRTLNDMNGPDAGGRPREPTASPTVSVLAALGSPASHTSCSRSSPPRTSAHAAGKSDKDKESRKDHQDRDEDGSDGSPVSATSANARMSTASGCVAGDQKVLPVAVNVGEEPINTAAEPQGAPVVATTGAAAVVAGTSGGASSKACVAVAPPRPLVEDAAYVYVPRRRRALRAAIAAFRPRMAASGAPPPWVGELRGLATIAAGVVVGVGLVALVRAERKDE